MEGHTGISLSDLAFAMEFGEELELQDVHGMPADCAKPAHKHQHVDLSSIDVFREALQGICDHNTLRSSSSDRNSDAGLQSLDASWMNSRPAAASWDTPASPRLEWSISHHLSQPCFEDFESSIAANLPIF